MKHLWVQQTLVFSAVVILVMGLSAAWISQSALAEFRKYITLREITAPEPAVDELAAYYARRDSWEGVSSLLAQGIYFGRDRSIFLGETLSESEKQRQADKRPGVQLADASGRVIYDSEGRNVGKQLGRGELAYAFPIVGVETDTTQSRRARGYLLLFFSVTGPLGEREQQFLDRVQRILLANTALAVVLILGVGALSSRRLNAPLQHLVDAAQAVAGGDLDQQVDIKGSVEVAQVGQAFNEMTAALQEAETLRQNMVADVAHELRTPLSVLQGNLWAILNDTYPLEKAEISSLYDETRLLSRLVEDLRELALADAGQLYLTLGPTDVAEIIRQTADSFGLAAESQKVSLIVQLADDLVPVIADADRVAQVLRNLLINALQHTPSGGSVTVSAVLAGEAVEIAIADTGVGIDPQDIPHVFERFWRADPARARSSPSDCQRWAGGTGLGLSVAKSLVEAQGGRIWGESTLGEGTVFRFTLPLA
jgi:two-component system OmpR family sensor kinase/two-component system sensor histidine kinase BaeS